MMKISSFLFSAVLGIGGLAVAADKPATQPTTKPYALDTCVVSGEKLGEMGDSVVYNYEGREVRFCCKACIADFKKDPQKYLKKLDEAEKAATTQPAAKADAHEGHQH